ncbi:GPR endopeptidase [Candidatus Desulforudis audaxviator]|uniref:Germination protease n=1 Tax=Desulforudis audaxviator (strain MP104C) TaxID=477974 RepID=B1I2E2_DESAP|nr:GPR endopeptidase [Candidatus Desulforudis audaxviator]ACA59165.1 spore protease [Candidatus Desulforudis audaxviator MP104C]AZK59234.1 Endopeptidase spore protease Gpr [Candidatus Desulforudis audaxviator]
MRVCGVATDLALEAHDALRAQTGREIPGVVVERREFQNGKVTTVNITTEQGAQAMGKPPGTYITIEAPALRVTDPEAHTAIVRELAEALKGMIRVSEQGNILVVGLGNWNATPDALGPRVANHTFVTRHVYHFAPEHIPEGTRVVSALSPGVLGITGIETAEIIKGVVEHVRPELVICIDALAAGSVERIASSIQLCDRGINPGSGIGGQRQGLTEETLGVKVISIGVPTVVHAAFIARDAIVKLYEIHGRTPPQTAEMEGIIQQLLEPFGGQLMVTPKEIDNLIKNCARIIAGGLSVALHPGIIPERFADYLQ